jgi:hypothetical protein
MFGKRCSGTGASQGSGRLSCSNSNSSSVRESRSGPVEAGAEVEVVGVQGGALVVRSAVRAVAPEPLRPAAAEKPDSTGPERLSRTLEEFEFEQLNRPEP